MKKIICVLLTIVIISSFLVMPLHASETDNQLPIDKPTNVAISKVDGDSPTTMNVAFSLPDSITQIINKVNNTEDRDAFFAEYGLSDFWYVVQMDWALDDVNDEVSGWHYTKYWDGENSNLGYDEEYRPHYSTWDVIDVSVNDTSIQEFWAFRGPLEEEIFTNNYTEVPLSTQLREEQYKYVKSDDDSQLLINFSEHTLYIRLRVCLITRSLYDEETGNYEEKHIFSDWTEAVSYGKDAEVVDLNNITLPKPVIADLYMTDKTFNGCPVAAFTLTVPEELATNVTKWTALGCNCRVFTEARIKGNNDWISMGNTDSDVKTGELECALLTLLSDENPVIDNNTEIELRCLYNLYVPGQDDVNSEYSDVITFKTTEMSTDPTPTETEPQDTPAEPVITPGSIDECSLCHKCSHPLGLCIWIWILLFIAVLAIVVFVIVKKCKKKD